MRRPDSPRLLTPSPGFPLFAEPSHQTSRLALPIDVAERLLMDAQQKAFEDFQTTCREETEQSKQADQEVQTQEIQEGRATRRERKKVVKNGVQVFNLHQMDQVWENTWRRQANDRRSRAEGWFQSARAFSGKRLLPSLRPAELNKKCEALGALFPHFGTAIAYLKSELMLSMSSKPSEFRVSPILLHGTPGIGKTTFASALADALNVPSDVISAGSAQGSFDIYGTSTHWENAEVGKVFRLVADHQSAAGILIIDEIDKMDVNGRYPILPALLDLLEANTARQFRDEGAGIRFDASKIIVVATANDIGMASEAILSRLHPIEIPEPTPEERLHLLKEMCARIQKAMKPKLSINDDVLQRIATAPGDLREMHRVLRSSIGHALAGNKLDIAATDLCFSKTKTTKPIGFIS